jgi:phage tail-like protein
MKRKVQASAAAFGLFLLAGAFSAGLADQTSPAHPATAPHPVTVRSSGDFRQYHYVLVYNGRAVASFAEMLAPAPEIVGRTKYESVTLERGVTRDAQFAQWASSVPKTTNATPPPSSWRNLSLRAYNEAGQIVSEYSFRAWVLQYSTLPALGANANAIAIEHIKIESEGWEIVPTPAPKP